MTLTDDVSSASAASIPRPKRANRTGSLHLVNRKVNGKSYPEWRHTGYLTGYPKMFTGTGKTPQEATASLQSKITKKQVELGMIGPEALELTRSDRNQTVEVLLYKWLAHEKPSLTLNSYKGYESKIRNYLVPAFGNTPIRLLTYETLQEYFGTTLPNLEYTTGTKTLTTRKLGTTAQKQIRFLLDAALKYAIKKRDLDYNPLQTVHSAKKNTRTKDEVKVLQKAAQWVPQQIAKTVEGQPNELRWLLALHGLRQGEVLGLTDDSLLPNPQRANRISIHQQLDRITAAHGCGKYDPATRKWACGKQANSCPKMMGETRQLIRTETKTKSGDRELPLSPILKTALKRQLAHRAQLRQSPNFVPLSGDKMDALLFVKSNGHPIRPQDDREEWARVLKDAHVKIPLRVHDARHLAATVAIEAGFSSDRIALMFGWSARHVQDILKVYGHPSAKVLKPQMDKFSEVLSQRLAAK